MAFQNMAARRRRAMAKRLYGWLVRLGLHNDLKFISKSTGIDMEALRNFRRATPKLETLEKIGRFIEGQSQHRLELERAL